MRKNLKSNIPVTFDVRDDMGNTWAAVSVVPSKDPGKRDILLIDVNDGNFSVRSITELLNLLEKKKVPFDERKKVLEFLDERLQFLEQMEI